MLPQSVICKLETRRAGGGSPSPRAGHECPAWAVGRGGEFSSPPPSCSVWAHRDREVPIQRGGRLLCLIRPFES